jgi:uncharacterized protein (TIGR03437 family)
LRRATPLVLLSLSLLNAADPVWFGQPQFLSNGPGYLMCADKLMPQLPFTGQAWAACTVSGVTDDVLRREVAYWHANMTGPYLDSMSLQTFYLPAVPAWDSFRLRNLDGGYMDHNTTGSPLYSISSSTYRQAFQAQVLRAVDAGADGIHIDDVQGQIGAMVWQSGRLSGSFDSVTMSAFVAYLQQKYTPATLQSQFGIGDIASFDFAAYIRGKGIADTWNTQPLSGLPQDFYLFERAQTLSFLRDLVTTTKQYAQQKYGRDFLFSCNDNFDPAGYLVRDVMDMTTAEAFYFVGSSTPFMSPNIKSWQGWKKPTAVTPEPAISAVTSTPLNKPTVNLNRVLIADIAASGGMPAMAPEANWWLNPQPVDLAVLRRYANFMLANPVLVSQIATSARVALLESAGSVLGGVVTTPGQNNPWAGQNNYTGTAKLLLDSGITYDSVFLPDTSYSSLPPVGADLSRYGVVIAPSAWALDDSQVNAILAWTQQGGTLVIIGDFGTSQQNGQPASRPQLQPLVPKAGQAFYGSGQIVVAKELFGQEYLSADVLNQRQARTAFQTFVKPYASADVVVAQPAAVHYEPGITPFFYRDRNGNALVHLVNYDYDLSTDQFYSKSNIGVSVRVGSQAVDEVILRSPDLSGTQSLPFTRSGDTIAFTVPQVDAWVVLAFQQNRAAPVIQSVSPAATLGAVGGGQISFSAQAGDADGNPLTYTWSVNGQVVADVFGPSYTLALPLTASGLYTVMVTVTDGSRVTQTSWTINVAAYGKPRVLFDEAHSERMTIDPTRASQLNPQHPDWVLYGILNQALQTGYQVSRLTSAPITALALSTADVLVLAAPDGALTAAENQAIAGFVQAGGGLMFIGDGNLNSPANTLLNPWGIQFNTTVIESPQDASCAPCFLLSTFAAHPAVPPAPNYLTNYGGSLILSQGALALASTSAAEWRSPSLKPTQQPAEPNGPFVMMAAAESGSGRIFASGDKDFMDVSLQYSGNSGNLNIFLSALAWVSARVNAPPAATSPSTARVQTVVNGGSFLPVIAPGGWVSVIGANLANTPPGGLSWSGSDFQGNMLPTALHGTSVRINGRSAAVAFASPGQLNIQAPDDSAEGTVPVEVVAPAGIARGTATLAAAAPSLFTVTTGGLSYAAAVASDGALLIAPGQIPDARAAHAGETVLLFGTGFGETSPHQPAGLLVTPAPLTNGVTAVVCGQPATVAFAGLVSPGLDQINVTLPAVPAGNCPLQLVVAGVATQSGVVLPIGQL